MHAQEDGRLPAEPWRAAWMTLAVLTSLWAAKVAQGHVVVGMVVATWASFAQLWLPVRRCDALQRPLAAVGLGGEGTGRAVMEAAGVLAVVLPAYALASWATARWAPLPLPGFLSAPRIWALDRLDPRALDLAAAGRLAESVATEVLGIALPEEVFFRGYLLPQLWRRWPPGGWAAALAGRAAWAAAALFALAHFIGEWSPARLAPALPGLLFGWLRWRQGTVAGCVAAHAGCNLFARALDACLIPVGR